MKTFRMIGMALFAVLMCVNFTACGGSDDEPEIDNESGVITSEKKLVEMKTTNGNTEVFSYDNKDRLSSSVFTEDYKFVTEIQYTWSNEVIIADRITYSLENNLIKSSKSDGELINFTYNSSNQLIEITHKEEYHDCYCTYIWDKDKLIEWNDEDEQVKISYDNKTCKGYFPILFPLMSHVANEVELFSAHPELIGVRMDCLPSKIIKKRDYYETIHELSYTLTDDGYIDTCTINSKYVDSRGEDSSTVIYTLKWQ